MGLRGVGDGIERRGEEGLNNREKLELLRRDGGRE